MKKRNKQKKKFQLIKMKNNLKTNNFFIIIPSILSIITFSFVIYSNIKINNNIKEIENIQMTNEKIFEKSEYFLEKQDEIFSQQNKIDDKIENMFNVFEMESWIKDFEQKNPELNVPNLNKN